MPKVRVTKQVEDLFKRGVYRTPFFSARKDDEVILDEVLFAQIDGDFPGLLKVVDSKALPLKGRAQTVDKKKTGGGSD